MSAPLQVNLGLDMVVRADHRDGTGVALLQRTIHGLCLHSDYDDLAFDAAATAYLRRSEHPVCKQLKDEATWDEKYRCHWNWANWRGGYCWACDSNWSWESWDIITWTEAEGWLYWVWEW